MRFGGSTGSLILPKLMRWDIRGVAEGGNVLGKGRRCFRESWDGHARRRHGLCHRDDKPAGCGRIRGGNGAAASSRPLLTHHASIRDERGGINIRVEGL